MIKDRLASQGRDIPFCELDSGGIDIDPDDPSSRVRVRHGGRDKSNGTTSPDWSALSREQGSDHRCVDEGTHMMTRVR